MFFIRDTPEIMPKESWKTKKACIRYTVKESSHTKPTDLTTKALTSLRKSLYNDKRFSSPKRLMILLFCILK